MSSTRLTNFEGHDTVLLATVTLLWGFPGRAVVKKPAATAGDTRENWFHPWVRTIPWRREWKPTPIFLPGKSHGQRNLMGCSPRSRKESDMKLSAHTLCCTTEFFFFPFIFISWRLITLQYWSGFCHTMTWISHWFTCVPHPDPPSRLPPYPTLLGLPSAPALSTCLMHPTWAGDLFHPW